MGVKGEMSRRQKTKDRSGGLLYYVLTGKRSSGRHKRCKREDSAVGFTFVSEMSQGNMNYYLAIWFAVFRADREGQKEENKSAQQTINQPLFMRPKDKTQFHID